MLQQLQFFLSFVIIKLLSSLSIFNLKTGLATKFFTITEVPIPPIIILEPSPFEGNKKSASTELSRLHPFTK